MYVRYYFNFSFQTILHMFLFRIKLMRDLFSFNFIYFTSCFGLFIVVTRIMLISENHKKQLGLF